MCSGKLMALTFLQPGKRQRYLFPLLIVVIFGIAFVVWNYFLAKPEFPSFEPLPPPEIKINFELLKSPILDELQLFEEISPFEEEIGRENPFVPYE